MVMHCRWIYPTVFHLVWKYKETKEEHHRNKTFAEKVEEFISKYGRYISGESVQK